MKCVKSLFIVLSLMFSFLRVSIAETLPDLSTMGSAFATWFKIPNFVPLNNYQMLDLNNYYDLHYVAVGRILNDQLGPWKIYDTAAWDPWTGQRVSAPIKDIQVDVYGKLERHMVDGFYFAYKNDLESVDRAVIQAITIWGTQYVNIWVNRNQNESAEELIEKVREYRVRKNIYKNSVIEYNNGDYKVHFLKEVTDFKLTWDDIILDSATKKLSKQETNDFILNIELSRSLKISPKKGILLYGPPGTGKSLLGQVIISDSLQGELKQKSGMLYVSARNLSAPYVVQGLFQIAAELSPMTLFMEDIDLIGIQNRDSGSKDAYAQMILNEMLNGMDGLSQTDGFLMIGTTNKVDRLDPALVRSGRLGQRIYFGLPKFPERVQFFQKFATKNVKWESGITLEWLATETEGFSGADIIEGIHLAKQMAFEAESRSGDDLLLLQHHFHTALAQIKKTIGIPLAGGLQGNSLAKALRELREFDQRF